MMVNRVGATLNLNNSDMSYSKLALVSKAHSHRLTLQCSYPTTHVLHFRFNPIMSVSHIPSIFWITIVPCMTGILRCMSYRHTMIMRLIVCWLCRHCIS